MSGVLYAQKRHLAQGVQNEFVQLLYLDLLTKQIKLVQEQSETNGQSISANRLA